MNKESYNFIEKYDRSSEKNSEKISYFIKQVFVPVTFLGGGVPHYAHSNEELCTFADMWIHDPEGITNNLLSGLNEHEFTMLKNISTKVWELTKDMNFQVAPKTGLLRQIYQKRLINRFFPNAETIEEVNVGISNYQYYEKSLDNEKVFFRLSTNSVSSLSDAQVISRFLQQATFGPTLNDINNIQNKTDKINHWERNPAPQLHESLLFVVKLKIITLFPSL